MRINKYIAASGICSRRSAEELITNNKVKVNGKVLNNLAFDVTVNDVVTINGKEIIPIVKYTYLAMHKPKGCVCTNKDEHDRKTVFALLPPAYKKTKLFCVGRLDYNTEGLLILTNDGEVCENITHPSSEVYKRYIARIEGEVTNKELAELRNGVNIDGKKTAPSIVNKIDYDKKTNKTRVEVLIYEGRNRQVRKMFESINKNVDFLVRKSIGEINLGGLNRGEVRSLTNAEIRYLKGLGK